MMDEYAYVDAWFRTRDYNYIIEGREVHGEFFINEIIYERGFVAPDYGVWLDGAYWEAGQTSYLRRRDGTSYIVFRWVSPTGEISCGTAPMSFKRALDKVAALRQERINAYLEEQREQLRAVERAEARRRTRTQRAFQLRLDADRLHAMLAQLDVDRLRRNIEAFGEPGEHLSPDVRNATLEMFQRYEAAEIMEIRERFAGIAERSQGRRSRTSTDRGRTDA